jgi:predicted alpha/beta hydrolase family esterase
MNVFLIHGSFGKPFENWFPWLEEKLAEKEVVCTIPSFPTPDHQTYSDWSRLLDYYFDMGVINSETILIGHSCGAVCATKYIADKRLNVRGLITVSGYNNYTGTDTYIDGLNMSFYGSDEKFSTVENYAQHRVSYISDNDPFISQEALKSFSNLIASKMVIIPNAGHFNASAGITSLPSLLELVLSWK